MQSYKIVLEDVHLEPSNAFIYLDGYRADDGKKLRLPLSPQLFEFPAGSEIFAEMTKLADGFRQHIGREINIQSPN
jgi:hypothetical protein